MKKLIDPHGRHIHKLRLSLLDACNFRCLYCMPQNPRFLPSSQLMTPKEIIHLVRILVDLGIDEIRVTGGEPTLRPDFLPIILELSSLRLKKLALTTNGIHLSPLLTSLCQTKCRSINISLDSLDETNFLKITGSPHQKKVMEAVLKAKEAGFHIKINVVLMKGINDHEIEDFVEFSKKHDMEVRFLELMKIGQARNHFTRHFFPAKKIVERLGNLSSLIPVVLPTDSTSFNYRLTNGAHIGIIASESRPFCKGCSRLRLSAEGQLRPCLMIDGGENLKNKTISEIKKILLKTMTMKPTDRIDEVVQPMNQIGG